MNKIVNLFSTVGGDVNLPASNSEAKDVFLDGKEASGTDNELFIRQAFKDDPKLGCELLYRHYYQGLCSHASRFVYSKSIAEDIVSDIFCQFYLNGTFMEISTSYRAFLYKSVRNRAYNYLRLEAKRTVELDPVYENNTEAACQQPDSVIEYEELSQQVEAAINSLPPKCRKIYLMHRFEDKKYSEIAEALQLSPRTVEVQIRKASQLVREALSKTWILYVLLLHSLC
ncbi:RNA polymerase sigma-70 factor [Pontibacter diazotrophicus]|uniref:RNA polymerase sigma-70 factor n=1 Tax=Pontibacter diazotrophicus TaxID=1400979 RepID=A0A3D8LDI8_9BACT|nr:RNA polymerase sigma-70 factor [Pontibacter diazotrophicus]RDV15460.1 RNA polymerase sigma-70 factor [Pontibacter diazotrophicus]